MFTLLSTVYRNNNEMRFNFILHSIDEYNRADICANFELNIWQIFWVSNRNAIVSFSTNYFYYEKSESFQKHK